MFGFEPSDEYLEVLANLKPGQRIATRNGKPYAITITNIGSKSKDRPKRPCKAPTTDPPPQPFGATVEELALLKGLFYAWHRATRVEDRESIDEAIWAIQGYILDRTGIYENWRPVPGEPDVD